MGWDDGWFSEALASIQADTEKEARRLAEELRNRPMTRLSAEEHILKAEELLQGAPDSPGNNISACHARVALAHAHMTLAQRIKEMGM